MVDLKSNFSNLTTALRFLSVDMINQAQSGHPGAPLGLADVATVLFGKYFTFYPLDARWEKRDRFILSNGHASALLYSLLYLTGYPDCTLDDLKKFRQIHSKTAGHPEYGLLGGVETTTGPLGQGLGNAVGMALAEKIKATKEKRITPKIYTFVGDGCLSEGLSYEATAFAGHHQLDNLIVLWDNNGITIDGKTTLFRSEDMKKRFESINWLFLSCDGHDFDSIDLALSTAQKSDLPVFISCNTIIGKGCPEIEGSPKAHGQPLGGALRMEMALERKWPYPPFEIPENILKIWRELGQRFQKIYEQESPSNTVPSFDSFQLKHLLLDEKKSILLHPVKTESSRDSFGRFLPIFLNMIPHIIGGSADLTSSNKTQSTGMKAIDITDLTGNYIHYGVREHAMAAMMNGLSLSGFRPYGGTFLSFTDYLRPSLRLSALMKQPVVYVATHDSISLGEDGPTHQPIEQLESLRAMPNLNVFRPCDIIETLECMELAFSATDKPSVLALSRETLPLIRHEIDENLCAKGGYLVKACTHSDMILVAAGSDVAKALDISEKLFKHKGLNACVFSMPCRELFESQPEKYKQKALPMAPLKIAIESGSGQGWYRYADIVLSLNDFGHSGRSEDVLREMNFTTDQLYIEIAKIVEGL